MNKLSIEELKVRAYNLIRLIDKARAELQQINSLIEQREQEDQTKQTPECTS